MTNNAEKLYSPAAQFKAKPGVQIIGSPDWNRTRDAMTLAAIRKYDDENHRLILKEAKEYRFNTFGECAAAKWHAWAWAMKKLGVKVVEEIERNPKLAQKMGAYFEHRLQKELKEKGIRCEERPPKYVNAEQDLWKSGMYVYYHGDIVYFISNPMKVRAKEGAIYLANRFQFMIVSNARVGGGENVFTSPGVKIRPQGDVQTTPGVPDGGAGEAKNDKVDAIGVRLYSYFQRMATKLKAWWQSISSNDETHYGGK